jgi:hypothetical protein
MSVRRSLTVIVIPVDVNCRSAVGTVVSFLPTARVCERRKALQITTLHGGEPAAIPIEIHLSTLLDLDDPQEACRWFGETILLLVPDLRTELFKFAPED